MESTSRRRPIAVCQQLRVTCRTPCATQVWSDKPAPCLTHTSFTIHPAGGKFRSPEKENAEGYSRAHSCWRLCVRNHTTGLITAVDVDPPIDGTRVEIYQDYRDEIAKGPKDREAILPGADGKSILMSDPQVSWCHLKPEDFP